MFLRAPQRLCSGAGAIVFPGAKVEDGNVLGAIDDRARAVARAEKVTGAEVGARTKQSLIKYLYEPLLEMKTMSTGTGKVTGARPKRSMIKYLMEQELEIKTTPARAGKVTGAGARSKRSQI